MARETLVSIIKESQKCDSLRVAYELKSKTLTQLIADNETNISRYETEHAKRLELQTQIDQKNKELNSWFKKPGKNWLVPALVGLAGGIILGASL